MNLPELREVLSSYRETVDREARELRDSYHALAKLIALYRRFDEGERQLADRVLSEWVLSDDENIRFDALALIGEFGIVSARPALRRLAERLVTSTSPGAPFEMQKLERLLNELAE